MTKAMGQRERIEKVIREKVRPQLSEHQGDIEIVELENNILKVRFLGKCSNCPSATMTLESVVSSAVMEECPEIEDVVLLTGVSDEMLKLAYDMLNHRDNLRDYGNSK